MLPIIVRWSVSSGQILLWAQIIFVWVCANYLTGLDPTGPLAIKEVLKCQVQKKKKLKIAVSRSVFAGIIVFFLAGFNCSHIGWRLLLALLIGGIGYLLPLLRFKLVERERESRVLYIAECEVLATFIIIFFSGLFISLGELHIKRALFVIPLKVEQFISALVILSGVIFLFEGATQIIRDYLYRVEAFPKVKEKKLTDEENVDTVEYNRGKLIGSLERLLLLIIIILGSYEALGLLIAGKGLIRSKNLEQHEYAEYFLVGTLLSTTLALIVGVVIKYTLPSVHK